MYVGKTRENLEQTISIKLLPSPPCLKWPLQWLCCSGLHLFPWLSTVRVDISPRLITVLCQHFVLESIENKRKWETCLSIYHSLVLRIQFLWLSSFAHLRPGDGKEAHSRWNHIQWHTLQVDKITPVRYDFSLEILCNKWSLLPSAWASKWSMSASAFA